MVKVGQMMVAFLVFGAGLFVGGTVGPSAPESDEPRSRGLTSTGVYEVTSEKHFIDDFSAFGTDESIHVVIEIPTGSTEKWEVDKTTGTLRWEFKHGKPRVVSYIGYPGNYGMIPRTLLSEEQGGDGDPLDVLVLGPAISKGEVVEARAIGVLKLLDGGEQDDKIIAVRPDSVFHDVYSISDLDRAFDGVTKIIELWFSNYKGPGEMVSGGFADVEVAREVIEGAALNFDTAALD